jgi:hypothetical protein
MDTAYVVITIVTAVVTAGIAAADLARAKFVLTNSAEVGVPPAWRPMLAALKLAGAAGLGVGLLGVRFVGVAAAVGLVLFFVGAVIAHRRARVFYTIAFPGGYLLLAIASLVLVLVR